MSIRDIAEKIKGLTQVRASHLRVLPDDLFLGFVIILVAFGAFGLGRLSKIEGAKTQIRIENEPESPDSRLGRGIDSTFVSLSSNKKGAVSTAQTASIIGATTGQLVASKSGKKYYYPWCTGVQKIKEENRIYFASKTEAEARGYTPSSTCKGL